MGSSLLYYSKDTLSFTKTNIETSAVTSSYYDIEFKTAFAPTTLMIWGADKFIHEDSADITLEVTRDVGGTPEVVSDTFGSSDLTGENNNLIVWESIGITGSSTDYRVKITTTDSFIHFDYTPILGEYKTFDADIKAPHTQLKKSGTFLVNTLNQIRVEFAGLSESDKDELVKQFYFKDFNNDLFDYGLLVKQDTDNLFTTDYYYGTLRDLIVNPKSRNRFDIFLNVTSR